MNKYILRWELPGIIFVFLLRFVNRPIKRLIRGTQRFAKGDYTDRVNVAQDDEMGQLGAAINQMGDEISKHQAELNKQRDEYQYSELHKTISSFVNRLVKRC